MIHPVPAHDKPLGAATPVLAIDDPVAKAWRTIVRIVAWIALVLASVQIVGVGTNSLFDSATVFGAVFGAGNAFRRGNAANVLMGALQFWYLLLMATLLVGAVATLRRRRWGPSVLLAYALGTVPGAVVSGIWLVVQNVHVRQQFPQMNQRPVALELVMYATSALAQLAFPAVLFAVMSRPAVRKQFAHMGPRSAFEPLSVTPARRPAQL
jgi:hypothetical protein